MGVLCEAELLKSSSYFYLEGVHGDGGRCVLIGEVVGLVITGRVLILIIISSGLGGGCPKADLSSFIDFSESLHTHSSLPILLCWGYPYLLCFVPGVTAVVESEKSDYLHSLDRCSMFICESNIKYLKNKRKYHRVIEHTCTSGITNWCCTSCVS